MHFNRLRLHGFKSFVEPTELEIAPGLTGIVGPNGCGKSNLVEALRWVMGENSPKSMRGGEMDDVIFAGTATRSSRNLAEVAIDLDNSDHSASAEYNNEELLQVTRQIERGCGSDYKINGKPVRRRDVQVLFADQATGAHSTNIVGQGQIDALIRAKPQDRRQILEEASGTLGLQARRHEAELKLKAADQNLTRVSDVIQSYDTQVRALKTQVRQASRYRNLADHIRSAEAALMHLRWQEAEESAKGAQKTWQASETRVNDLLSIVTRGTTKRAEIAAKLPSLRQAEAASAVATQKLMLARDQIDQEIKRIAEEIEDHERRLVDVKGDLERERSRHQDGEASIVKLKEEALSLAQAEELLGKQLPEASQNLNRVTEEVEAFDAKLNQLIENTATAEARKSALAQEIESLAIRRAHLSQRREQLDAQRASLASEAAGRPDLALASALLEATTTELSKRQQQAHAVETLYREAERLQAEAREAAQQAETEVTKLRAENDALVAILATHGDTNEQVIDLISVTPGLENALALAIGEALTAALDPKAAKHWRRFEPKAAMPSLPQGVTPLDRFVKAPEALKLCISQIGVAENVISGEQAADQLKPGQMIVSREGWAWRWDGFTLTPEAKTTTALRLLQRNRVGSLKAETEMAATTAQKAQEALVQAQAFFTKRQEEDREAREALKAAFTALNDARDTYTHQEKGATVISSRMTSLDESLAQLHSDFLTLRTRVAEIEEEQKNFPDLEKARSTINENRAQLIELRSQQALRQSECDRLTHERDASVARTAALAADIAAWQTRLTSGKQQIEAFCSRITDIEKRREDLRQRPATIEASRSTLLDQLSTTESKRKQAADLVIATELELSQIEQQLKRDESASHEAREERVRAEGNIKAAAEHFNVLRERMEEKLQCAPEALKEIAGLRDDESAPVLSELEHTLARYTRERENMGPVNLCAETEAETLQEKIDTLQKDKDDLEAAISKLRQGIGQLNREARERLQTAFTSVNERFQNLYKVLFTGGRAHLELIDDEDPMNAGLEIFASPPGKKMQMLSLLSGGERTLTALALLFAVFQTNPSPICVLDEAEAALDESNITRFCDLVEKIAEEAHTRFLIITHQRITMARMDRLFGVTMSEKGVSQLVSVDLDAAVAIRDTGSKAEAALRDVRAA